MGEDLLGLLTELKELSRRDFETQIISLLTSGLSGRAKLTEAAYEDISILAMNYDIEVHSQKMRCLRELYLPLLKQNMKSIKQFLVSCSVLASAGKLRLSRKRFDEVKRTAQVWESRLDMMLTEVGYPKSKNREHKPTKAAPFPWAELRQQVFIMVDNAIEQCHANVLKFKSQKDRHNLAIDLLAAVEKIVAIEMGVRPPKLTLKSLLKAIDASPNNLLHRDFPSTVMKMIYDGQVEPFKKRRKGRLRRSVPGKD